MSETFGQRLRRVREEAGISRIQLGNLICATGDAIRAWELGLSYPRLPMLPTIASTFNVSTDYLLTGKDRA